MEEPWLQNYIRRSGRLFLDIGANEGQWTKSLATGYERVIAFEADPRACDKLMQNLPKNAHVICKGAWNANGELHAFHRFLSTRQGSFFREETDEQTGPRQGDIQVETVTIDSLDLPDVDFIKIDTEGSEYNILQGAIQTIKCSRPRMLIEIHNRENGELVSQFLGQLGFPVVVIHHPNYTVNSDEWSKHFWISC